MTKSFKKDLRATESSEADEIYTYIAIIISLGTTTSRMTLG
jgi:hypothetical protein